MAVIALFKRRAGWITGLIAVAIGYASLTPLPELPVPGSDKLHHFIAYASLTFPLLFANAQKWWRVVVPATAYGGAIELIQPYVNRYGEWLDFAANTAGCLLGLLLALAAQKALASWRGSDVAS